MTQYWRSKRVLVTGSTGFVGTAVCRKLNELGAAKIVAPSSAGYHFTRPEEVEKLFADAAPDFAKAKRLFGFVATTPLGDGLSRTIEWYVADREAAEAATL
jgi:nucleoside-diphosphate-sugar epimerase